MSEYCSYVGLERTLSQLNPVASFVGTSLMFFGPCQIISITVCFDTKSPITEDTLFPQQVKLSEENMSLPIHTYPTITKHAQTYQNRTKPFNTYQNLLTPIKTFQHLSKPFNT